MDRKEFLYSSSTLIGGLSLGKFPYSPFSNIKNIRIGLITDLHYAARDPFKGNNRYYRDSLEKLSDCITVMNREDVDFLIQIGDFKDQDEPPVESATLEYLETMVREFNYFDGPTYHVMGNHDHDSISKQQFLERVTISGFKKAKNFYSFNRKGFHFIVLDANYTSESVPYDHGNFDWKDCFVPIEQLEWLRKDLDKSNKPTIVFIHQRLDEKEDNRNYCVANATEIRSVLENSNRVNLVLQGHYHEGDISSMNGIVYYTLKAAIEGSGIDNNSFAILEINQKLEMNLIGYRKTETTRLTV